MDIQERISGFSVGNGSRSRSGNNYMEVVYERDHEMFPDRVILGSENFPKEIGWRWPFE